MLRMAIVIAAFMAALWGCAEQPSKEAIGTGAGAAIGGIVGREVTDDTTGTIVGGVIGAIVGGRIGAGFDEQDRRRAYSALESNTPETWINPETDRRYTFQPTETYRGPGNRICREYRTTILVEGRTERATGRACQRADGTWEVVG